MKSIGLCCKENEFIINIKKDKTEFRLFIIAKTLEIHGRMLKITEDFPIHFVTNKKNPSIILDRKLLS